MVRRACVKAYDNEAATRVATRGIGMASSDTGEFLAWLEGSVPRPEGMVRALEAVVREAGAAILQVYETQGSIAVETKADDSPLTQADRASHQTILKRLAELTRSEERRVGKAWMSARYHSNYAN